MDITDASRISPPRAGGGGEGGGGYQGRGGGWKKWSTGVILLSDAVTMDAATDVENNNANLAGDGGVDDDLAPSHLSQDPDDGESQAGGGGLGL